MCDEPLAALDRKLRQSMQVELKGLQQQLGITTIFVTHDQEEAMTVSDRIAVMNAGRIEQTGTAREIYDRPRTRFVSDFIGEINLFAGEWHDGAFIADGKPLPAPAGPASGKATIAVRPERIRLSEPTGCSMTGRIHASSFISGQINYRLILDDGRQMMVKQPATRPERLNCERVGVHWTAEDAVVLDPD